MYAIVQDTHSGDFWIQGDEGRVGQIFESIILAYREAVAMARAGYEVDTEHYYLNDPNDGTDWDNPLEI